MLLTDHFESYFVPASEINYPEIRIQGEEHRHLARAKRKRVGDIVYITDGQGTLYTAELMEIRATYTIAKILKAQRLVGEPLVRLTLAQGVIRSQRMDWIIEKGTELGVNRFVPVHTRYSLTSPSELKQKRWERLAMAALKQSGRSVLPAIDPVVRVEDLQAGLPRPVLFAHPGCKTRVREAVFSFTRTRDDPLRTISILVGPEGGFSNEEVEQFLEWNYCQVSLGERRLRSETAAITLVSLVMDALEEL